MNCVLFLHVFVWFEVRISRCHALAAGRPTTGDWRRRSGWCHMQLKFSLIKGSRQGFENTAGGAWWLVTVASSAGNSNWFPLDVNPLSYGQESAQPLSDFGFPYSRRVRPSRFDGFNSIDVALSEVHISEHRLQVLIWQDVHCIQRDGKNVVGLGRMSTLWHVWI